MPGRQDHDRNIIANVRINPCARSFILCLYDVLAGYGPTPSANRARGATDRSTAGGRPRSISVLSRGPVEHADLVAQSQVLELNDSTRTEDRGLNCRGS